MRESKDLRTGFLLSSIDGAWILRLVLLAQDDKFEGLFLRSNAHRSILPGGDISPPYKVRPRSEPFGVHCTGRRGGFPTLPKPDGKEAVGYARRFDNCVLIYTEVIQR